MRKATSFRKPEGSDEQEERKSQGLGCCAHGCKLAGVFSDSVKGGGNFRCWAHDRIDNPRYWDFLTTGINENFLLFRFADRLLTTPLFVLETKKKGEAKTGEQKANDYLVMNGFPELARKENTGQWSDRITKEPLQNWVGRIRIAAFDLAAVEARRRIKEDEDRRT